MGARGVPKRQLASPSGHCFIITLTGWMLANCSLGASRLHRSLMFGWCNRNTGLPRSYWWTHRPVATPEPAPLVRVRLAPRTRSLRKRTTMNSDHQLGKSSIIIMLRLSRCRPFNHPVVVVVVVVAAALAEKVSAPWRPGCRYVRLATVQLRRRALTRPVRINISR